MIKIYYQKSMFTTLGHGINVKAPTKKVFKEDYAAVWESDATGMPLEFLFKKFNLPEINPLSTEVGQNKLRALGVKHTSMSVGDIVKNEKGYWIVDNMGFRKIKL
jgi:hypothetical protein